MLKLKRNMEDKVSVLDMKAQVCKFYFYDNLIIYYQTQQRRPLT